MTDQQQKFEQWAIVELLGRKTVAGFVSEQLIAGQALLRVDVPAVDDQPGFTQLYGSSSVYCITPTTEEIARVAASRLNVRPVAVYHLPEPNRQLVDSYSQLSNSRQSGWTYDGPGGFGPDDTLDEGCYEKEDESPF